MLRSLKISIPEIHAIVESNEKQRFKMIPIGEVADLEGAEESLSAPHIITSSTDASQWLIRANQGHSINVDEDGLLEPVTLESEVPSTVVHGTTAKAWPLIISSGGLKKMTRNHVHFAPGLPSGFKSLAEASSTGDEGKKEPVISGMRNSSSILIFIDVRQALESGIKFWRSANGVILSNGNDKGVIPTQYFQRVEDRKTGRLVMEDGQMTTQCD
jgi:2'-phosphotransferase